MKIYQRLTVVLLMVCSLQTVTAAADKDTTIVYNEARPLIYEDAWDLWPYVFLNENGEPDGYNIDLLKMIFKELNIPYIIKLKPTLEAQKDLKEKKSDLMLRMDASFTRNNASYGQTIVQLFTHSVVTPTSKHLEIRKETDMGGHTIIVHEGSFSHYLIKEHGWADDVVGYDDMQEAIQKVSAEDDGIIIWNTMSLKWLMQKFQTTNLQLDPIDLPYGEYKFFANDHHLLAQMDSVYANLRANDKLTPIQNKWFYPEKRESGIPSWIWDLIMILAAVAFCIVVYYIIYKVREDKMTREIRKSNARLALIMKTSHVGLWTYDVDSQVFAMVNEHGKIAKAYSSLEFSRYYIPADFKILIEALKKLIENKTESVTLDLKTKPTEESEEREFTTTLSVLRRNKHNRPTIILCSESDVTEERIRQAEVKDNRLRYQSVFESAMIDMFSYDKDGYIYDMNQKAKAAMPVDMEKIRDMKISVGQVLGMDDLDLQNLDYIYVTQLFRGDDPNDNRPLNKFLKRGLMYYELQITALRDSQNKLLGIYGSGRDVTEVARSYQTLQDNIQQLQEKNEEVTTYVKNIDYVLSVGGISLVRYSLDNHILTIYSEINQPKYALTQTRALSFVHESSKHRALRLLTKMDNGQAGTFHEDMKINLRRKDGVPLYMQLHFIPTYQNGQIKEYFGMCRDISDIKMIEAKLEQETIRAQEVEVVKNAFLHNMSHEIRTPLNSVVGFSELFEMEHSTEDEAVFIKEIKESSAALLKLINDILFLSRLDAGMITINQQPIDFASVFESRCDSAWMNDKKPGVDYIVKNPYQKLVIEIDEPKVSMIMEKIINNAAQHTTAGSILARYDYIGDQLVVSIEDSGDGIPEDAIEHIFERFVTGANTGVGLGLSICHELIEYMGGKIQLKSKKGQGTAVWFTLPCKVLEWVRK